MHHEYPAERLHSDKHCYHIVCAFKIVMKNELNKD